MSSTITAMFKATIGLLVNKGRDKAAKKLKYGDVTDQRFRALIVREIDDIKSNLDGLARKDLLTSISFFKEGIELLYEVFEKESSRSEYRMAKAQATTGVAGAKTVSMAKKLRRKMKLTGPGDSYSWALANAKDRFKDARKKATEAFNNEALELSDRVLAMQYRVMATTLETVDNPMNALAASRVCIEELHRLSAVKDCFAIELKQGFLARFSKDERRAVISSTCHMNRVIYDVMLMVCFGNKQLSANNWPCIDTGKEKIDPLRDDRVAGVLQKQGMEECCVTPRLFGQEGDDDHMLTSPSGISTDVNGQFVIADDGDKSIKVFDSSGHFILKIAPQIDDGQTKLEDIHDVATDEESNIYALVELQETGTERGETRWTVLVYSSAADQLRKFPVNRSGGWGRLTVSKNKVLVAWEKAGLIDVFELDGRYVDSFGHKILRRARDITAGPDGVVIVLDRGDHCIHVFTEDGQQLRKFSIRTEEADYYCAACHPGGEHVIAAGRKRKTHRLFVAVYNKDGECQRTLESHERTTWLGVTGISVSMEGRTAVSFLDPVWQGKVVVF